MPGTRAGGLKAVQTTKQKYGQDFYKGIGKVGGTKSRGGGFAANPELAKRAGAKGGKISRRGKAKPKEIIQEPTKERNVFSSLINFRRNK